LVEQFIDMCAFCKQGVSKTNMSYQKGRVFHPECYIKHGVDFATPDSELAQLSARTRVELVQLKNMQVRIGSEKQRPKPPKKKSIKKTKRKAKAKRAKPKRTKPKRKSKKLKKSSKKSRRRR
jgi:hypothetical protein